MYLFKKKIITALVMTALFTLASKSGAGLHSEVYLLIDRDTKEVLVEKNADKKIHPASMTKIMTTLVALDALNEETLESYYELPLEIFDDLTQLDASVAGFQAYEEVKIIDLLYGIMLPSGADATRAIAHYVSGDEASFVDLMNEKAKALGLKDTHFMNTSGLDHSRHISTAHDLAIILEAALENDTFETIYSTTYYQTSPTSHNGEGLAFTDKNMEYAKLNDHRYETTVLKGAKSGYTDLAGSSLTSIASYQGANYMVVSSQAPFSYKDYYNVQDALKLYHQAIDGVFEMDESEREVPIKPEPQETSDRLGFMDLVKSFGFWCIILGLVSFISSKYTHRKWDKAS